MILQALYHLYDRLASDPAYGLAEPGTSVQKVSFAVVLTPEGSLHHMASEMEPHTLRDAKGKSRTVWKTRQVKVLGQAKPPGQGINPCLLCDNQAYMLGYDPDNVKPERTVLSFQKFRQHHLDLEKEIQDPGFSAVCRFLEQWQPAMAADHPLLKDLTSGFGVFRIQAMEGYVHQRPRIRQWWQERQPKQNTQETGHCLITGQKHQAIALTHDPIIKGVRDAQPGGSKLVSFNCKAFESYKKEQSHNAPVSENAAFRYCNALNALLDGPRKDRHRFYLGDATMVFWTATPTWAEAGLAAFFSGSGEDPGDSPPDPGQDPATLQSLQVLFKALREGSGALATLGDDPSTPFYILGLSPNAARISVRTWHVSTLGTFVERLRSHYQALRMMPSRDRDREFPPNWTLLRETARETKEIPPLLGGALMRAILEERPYPQALAAAVIRRIRADRQINYLRAAMLKAWLTRSPSWQGEIPVSLDPNRLDPAYRLGRLFAVLEKTQEEALPGLNATIRDRYFGAVSATPGTVMPRLLRTYQHHLAKLNPGAKVNRERLVQQIVAGLDAMPATLSLEEQGLFAIGYYHQRQDFFTRKVDESNI